MKKKRLFQLFGLLFFILGLKVPLKAQMMANVQPVKNEFSEKSQSDPITSEIECAVSLYYHTASFTRNKLIRSYSQQTVNSRDISKAITPMDGLWQLCVANNGQCEWDINDKIPDNVVGIEEVIMMLRMSAGDLPFDFDRYISNKVRLGAKVFKLKNGVISLKLFYRNRGETSILIDVNRSLLLGINEYNHHNMLTRKLTCDYSQKGSMTILASVSFQNYSYEKNGVNLTETITQFTDLSVDREKRKVSIKSPQIKD